MNIYTTKFFAHCPNNQVRVEYRLRIESRNMLGVEEIIEAVGQHEDGFHEEIADALLTRFGGTQTLTADHHGVTIETVRAK